MQQPQQESGYNFSLYVFSKDEEGRKELTARPINKEVLMKAMVDLKLEGQWRVHQTACGLLVRFMREEDLMTFQNLDLSAVLGIPASAFGISSLDTHRQLGDPVEFDKLLNDRVDFRNSARLAKIPSRSLAPPTLAAPRDPLEMRDRILQCFKCQGFGHYASQCLSVQRCVRCGDSHAITDCPRPRNDPVCVHCSGRHHAAYKNCPVRLHMQATSVYLSAFMPPYSR